MRFLKLLALFSLLPSAAAQEQEIPADLQQLLERVRAGSARPPACAVNVDEPGKNMHPDECKQRGLVCMRVRNASNVRFDSFRVGFSGHSEEFGPISPGETSAYRHVGCAYWYNYAEARAGERRYVRLIIDHIGDAFLAPGLYTAHYQVNTFFEPLSGDGWIIHGDLREEMEVGSSAQ